MPRGAWVIPVSAVGVNIMLTFYSFVVTFIGRWPDWTQSVFLGVQLAYSTFAIFWWQHHREQVEKQRRKLLADTTKGDETRKTIDPTEDAHPAS